MIRFKGLLLLFSLGLVFALHTTAFAICEEVEAQNCSGRCGMKCTVVARYGGNHINGLTDCKKDPRHQTCKDDVKAEAAAETGDPLCCAEDFIPVDRHSCTKKPAPTGATSNVQYVPSGPGVTIPYCEATCVAWAGYDCEVFGNEKV